MPFNGTTVFDSDEIVEMPRLPRSLTVIGAGVIGVEYATIFSALDVAVTLVEPRPDASSISSTSELIDEFIHELRDRGVALRLGAKVNAIEIDEQGWPVTMLEDGRRVRTEMLLLRGRPRRRDRRRSTSRPAASQPTIAAGMTVDPRDVPDRVPHIYAAGDVIGFPSLASTSMEQGRIAACHALRRGRCRRAPEFFPYGIYSVPEISTVGHERGGGARARHSLRVRHRPLPRDLARPHHGAEQPA